MANWYVWSGAGGAATGADWTNAYLTVAAALTAKAAGDVFFVAHDHAEAPAAATAINWTSPGTEVNSCRIYCVNRAGSVPPVAADLRNTATFTTQTTGGFSFTGSVSECYGINLNAGTVANLAVITLGQASRSWRFVNCKFNLVTTHASGRINCGLVGGGSYIFEDCTFQFAAVGQAIVPAGRAVFRNSAGAALIAGATIPTSLFAPSTAASFLVEGVDFSAVAAGKSLVNVATAQPISAVFKDCKLHPSGAIIAGSHTGAGGMQTTLIRCDSADTNYRTEHFTHSGSQFTETAIVRSGGASDGATPIAWRIVTSTMAIAAMPFECLPISVWNETIGSPITVTVEGIWGTGVVPTNAEIWMDVEYLGSSGYPLGLRATSGRASLLETASNIPAGSGTWGGSTTKFAMSVTVTPQEKGPITVYVKAAKSASTFYIDPKPVLT